ncbi:HNH endonuclease [Vibrio alginolyticus]|uniref:HNH endonuclease n=1 Tax=Vibrio alginolyticus TaxID=663 RepID=UPI001BD30964|nr:HNH endonuclease [Vibrio alginolyticus]MBT0110588.1 HNH endonuclease [Vibrio alginolyticus]
MSFPPLSNNQKESLDKTLKAMGLNRSKVSEEVRINYLSNAYNSKESARGTINHWARGKTSLPTRFAEAIEKIVGTSIQNLVGSGDTEIVYPDDIQGTGSLFEGASKQITVNVYERNSEARQKCLDHYGYDCVVCEFNFFETYGELGKKFIHVHHVYDISLINDSYVVDPIKHLRPVCPNCHAMLHKERPAMSVEVLKEKLKLKLGC